MFFYRRGKTMRRIAMNAQSRNLCRTYCGFVALALLSALSKSAAIAAEDVQWIWSPAYEKEQAPEGVCCFRKSFNLSKPESGEIQITADDRYQLFVNGRQVGKGDQWKKLDSYDITEFLVAGPNVVAVLAENLEGKSAGLAARVIVKQQGGTFESYSTDGSWKTALKELPRWQMPKYNDNQWLSAQAFGKLGGTLPWGTEVLLPNNAGRFKVLPKFQVEWLIEPQETGSLIGMAFNEFGQMLVSREEGALLLVSDSDRDGLLDLVTTFSDEVKNCQGILCISGKVYVTAEGPQGPALYRLTDEDHDGQCDQVEALLKFSGQAGEHGPHGLALGPDGFIYMVVGNFMRVETAAAETSPYHHYYEGDLVTPRYEDAGGHAVGIKAPGGSIVRTDLQGSFVELVAGGLQNPYDLAFNAEGEIFTADSDMEWDMGMPWYRPTRFLHVVPGGEFGWRSGWAKWPEYFLDSLPPTLETGRGSPTGLVAYNHVAYPRKYHNAIFVCDWSRGRILAVRTKADGGSYAASSEVFLEGRPLNVTDAAVGADGWLYFCTGGRGTEGGIYRVVWEGKVPPSALPANEGIEAALQQPQLSSAWARQRVALLKQEMGPKWPLLVRGAALDVTRPVDERVRALELMHLLGPLPNVDMLIKLCGDKQPLVRAKSAFLLGIYGEEQVAGALGGLLDDEQPYVQRVACEAIARSGVQPQNIDRLVGLLGSPDRYIASAARRAIQTLPVEVWEAQVLESPSDQIFLNGAAAILPLNQSDTAPRAVLGRASRMLQAFISDDDFLDLMRVMQLACVHGKITGNDIPELRKQLVDEYPSQDEQMNREVVRLLAYLQAPEAAKLFAARLGTDAPTTERLHVALHSRFLEVGWTTDEKLTVLKFLEEARNFPGGHSFGGMLENVSRDFFASFTEDERQLVLSDGAQWPTSALSVLAKLKDINPGTLAQVRNLDRQVKGQDTEAVKRLRTGIVAVLGTSKEPASMAYLRELWDTEPDRRVTIAIGLAQQPDGDNWEYLVRSLAVVEGAAAQEVITKLVAVDRKPDDPEALRQVIIRGLLVGDAGNRSAVNLLEKWTGEKQGNDGDAAKAQLEAWQNWFAENYADYPEAKLPVDSESNNWTHQELLAFLTSPGGPQGDAERGAVVFEKAQCVKCHAFGQRGERIGPDLTTVSRRFQKKEILESILFPSQVISDQYATHSLILDDGRTITGMVSPVGDGTVIVLQSDGEKLTLTKDQVETVERARVSSMPEGLLNTLSLDEVADLFAYLNSNAEPDVATRPAASPR
jgi:putative heme-binding domain-containing protein